MSVSSVLVAVRGDESDEDAVKLACEMLPPKGRLHILYVIEVERGLPLDAEIGPATARAEEVLKHMERVAKPFKRKTEAELVQSRKAACAVVQEAVDKEVDTIIVGSSYEEKYGTFNLGETIPYVLKNAPCQVIIWRDHLNKNYKDGNNGSNGQDSSRRWLPLPSKA
jgi:nucleotide-binding universal stress UspA family protein